jgi:hypothetical protein
MNKKTNKLIFNKIKNILIAIFIYSSIILPASEILNIKKLSFFGLLIYQTIYLLLHNKYISTKLLFRYLLFFTIIILWTLPTSSTNDISHASFIISASLVLLSSFIFYDELYFSYSIFLKACILLSFIVCIMGLSSAIFPIASIILRDIFLKLNSGYLGFRQFGSIKLMMIHFRTSPVLIIAAIHYFIESVEKLNKRNISNILYFFIIISAIILSASRSLIIFTFIGLIFTMIIRIKKNGFYKISLVLSIIIIGILYSNVIKESNIFSKDEVSNSIKLNHINSYLSLITEKPLRLIIGFGTGSSYFSTGFGDYTWQTEILILDMFRYFGIPIAIFTIFIFLFPIKYKIYNSLLFIPFILYFINAFLTNPLIFNSTGMLIIALYWAMTSSDKHKYLLNI